MTVLEVFAAAAAVVALGFLVWRLPDISPLRRYGYRAKVHPPAGNVAYQFDPATSWHGRGGVRIGRINASYPLARLDVDHQYAAVRSPWGRVVISRSDVVNVRVIGLISPGLRFDSVDGRFDGLIFWTFNSGGALNAFGWFGWPVSAAQPQLPQPGLAGGQSGAGQDVLFPGLPPPPTGYPVSKPPEPPPPPRPPPPAPAPAPVPPPAARPPSQADGPSAPVAGRFDSALQTGRYVGRYLAAAAMVLLTAVFAASFVPSLTADIDLSSLAFATIPVAIVLFVFALLSLLDTSRASRAYRPVGMLSAIPLPESWAKRLLVFAAMALVAGSFFVSLASTTTDPQHVGNTYTVNHNGVSVVTDEAEYDRIRARQERPFLLIPLVFVTFAYVLIADADDESGGRNNQAAS